MKARNLFFMTGRLTATPKLSYTEARLPYVLFFTGTDISCQQNIALIDHEIVQVQHDPS